MNSKKQAADSHDEQQAILRAQIAALQAQLDPTIDQHPKEVKVQPGNKRVLVAGSPSKSPAKKRRLDDDIPSTRKPLLQRPSNVTTSFPSAKSVGHVPASVPGPPRSSNIFSAVNKLSIAAPSEAVETITRTTGFGETPSIAVAVPRRDDNLALVENLEPGPKDHKAPPEDPNLERLEPNSGIRLSSRRISHSDLQQHLTGRFYLPPSLLYSIVRLSTDKQAYDVPVSGDWITIAVIAERGEVKYSRGGTKENSESEDESLEGDKAAKKKKRKDGKQERKSQGKKFISFKLVDFGTRGSGPATASDKGTSRGDALMNLLLFESNVVGKTQREHGDEQTSKKKMTYKGGSGGAFETWATVLREGTVVALLNPRVLRPFQRDAGKPHPIDNILALTPSSGESVMPLGLSLDLGKCTARRRDGTDCGGWYDKRTSEVCEYHITAAVKAHRAARPEFTAGTSGMATSRFASGPNYQKKQGLLPAARTGPTAAPRDSGGGPTYVLGGYVVNSAGGRGTMNTATKQPEVVSEKIGRERAERNLRKGKKKKLEEDLTTGLRTRANEPKLTVVGNKVAYVPSEDLDKAAAATPEGPGKLVFSAEAVKRLGFNPSFVGPGGVLKKNNHTTASENRETHARMDRRDAEFVPKLHGPPGPKVRSGVSVPAGLSVLPKEPQGDGSASDLDFDIDQHLCGRHGRGDLLAPQDQPSASKGDSEEGSDLEIEGYNPTLVGAMKRKASPNAT